MYNSGDENLAIADSELFGIRVKVICLLEETDKDYLTQPMGIIVNDALFKALKPPEEYKDMGKVFIRKKKKEKGQKPGNA